MKEQKPRANETIAQKIVKYLSSELIQEWKGVDDDVRESTEEEWMIKVEQIINSF